MRSRRFVMIGLMIALSIGSVTPLQAQTPQPITQQGVAINRSTSLTIKIVFLGIGADQLNSTYLTSNVTLPLLKYQTILAGPLNTGVIYNFNYQLMFADSSIVTSFARFLRSIEQNETTLPSPSVPSNPYFTNSSTLSQAQNSFFAADRVESWLGTNMTLFGGNPTSGYTLFVADLSNATLGIPSFSYPEYQGYSGIL